MKERKGFHEICLTEEEKIPYYASIIEGRYGFILMSLFKLSFTLGSSPFPTSRRKSGISQQKNLSFTRAESFSMASYQNAIQFMIDQRIILRHKDRGQIEGTYFTLIQERKKIYWKKEKEFLAIYR